MAVKKDKKITAKKNRKSTGKESKTGSSKKLVVGKKDKVGILTYGQRCDSQEGGRRARRSQEESCEFLRLSRLIS